MNSNQATRSCLALRRSGGTLLEVLVSLVVIAMIMQLVSQASARMHSSQVEMKNRSEGTQAVIAWRSAERSGAVWAQGEEGRFADGSFYWRLSHVRGQSLAGREEPDDLWRVLELRRADEKGLFWHTLVRLPDAMNAPSTRPAETIGVTKED